MKVFNVIPNFSFWIEANDIKAAEKVAYQKVNEICSLVGASFDFVVEEEYEV